MNILDLPDDILYDSLKITNNKLVAKLVIDQDSYNNKLIIRNYNLSKDCCLILKNNILKNLNRNIDYQTGCIWSGRYFNYEITNYSIFDNDNNIIYLVLPTNNYSIIIEKILNILNDQNYKFYNYS